MHTIIICGTPWCELENVQQILKVAGVSAARAAPSGSSTDINTWYDRLFFNQPATGGALSISKAWELGASQIFLANWDQPVWGWADSRSTWLLDFWRDFDATTHFVLLYTSPKTVLTRALADTSSDRFAPMKVLDQWCVYQTELLKFFHRNRSRCVLLDVDQALTNPSSLIRSVNQQFEIHLVEQTSELAKYEKINPLDQWLAQQLLQSHPAALALEQEIQASLPISQEIDQITLTGADAVLAPEAADQLRQLYRQQAELLATANQTNEQVVTLHNQVQNQAQTQQELQQQNEVLLMQLHQTQGELENHFLQCQTLQQQNTELALARDAESQAKIDAISHFEALKQENASLHSQIQNQIPQENEGLLLQLHQLQEELENNFLQCQALQQQNTKLVQARDAEAQAKNDVVARHDALEQVQASMQQTQQQIQNENEVLLLQLHQVQEELEHYFLLNQQNQQDKKILEDRWNRLVTHYPDYCEWDRIEVLDASEESARWLVHGLMSTGNTLPTIDVSLELINGSRALLIYPPTQPADAPLLHWANSFNTLDNAPLRLEPDAEVGSTAMRILRSLAPTDLLRLQSICSALAQDMPATQPGRESLMQHLQDLKTLFKELPATWRFDAVRLKHEQVNPGYEHLCFNLANARFGERQWPEFEFRIGAANVKKGKFSALPRLEFPLHEQGNTQFENWFNESENAHGPKFELRFDIKANAIDVAAWQALNPTDQLQMLSIMATLPRLLSQLEQQGTKISRPWDEWRQLAIGMQKTMQSLGLPASTFEVI